MRDGLDSRKTWQVLKELMSSTTRATVSCDCPKRILLTIAVVEDDGLASQSRGKPDILNVNEHPGGVVQPPFDILYFPIGIDDQASVVFRIPVPNHANH